MSEELVAVWLFEMAVAWTVMERMLWLQMLVADEVHAVVLGMEKE
jgi:hypothetical protein